MKGDIGGPPHPAVKPGLAPQNTHTPHCLLQANILHLLTLEPSSLQFEHTDQRPAPISSQHPTLARTQSSTPYTRTTSPPCASTALSKHDNRFFVKLLVPQPSPSPEKGLDVSLSMEKGGCIPPWRPSHLKCPIATVTDTNTVRGSIQFAAAAVIAKAPLPCLRLPFTALLRGVLEGIWLFLCSPVVKQV